jgi:hypothetical protein
MTTLPGIIATFFDATNRGDTRAFLAAFAPNAVLVDWGRTFIGVNKIASWDQTDNIGVASQLTVLSWTGDDNGGDAKVAVKGGGFNGTGTMTFACKQGLIQQLTIR